MSFSCLPLNPFHLHPSFPPLLLLRHFHALRHPPLLLHPPRLRRRHPYPRPSPRLPPPQPRPPLLPLPPPPQDRPPPHRLPLRHRRPLLLCSCSLRRNGASILEYYVGPGTAVEPYADRLLVVRQCLDASLSPSSYYPAPGYRLLSPVLGLLFYNPNGSQLRIASITLPISIDFSESAGNAPAGAASVCTFWDLAGNVRLSELASGGKVCLGYKEGHYGLLVEERVRVRMPVVKWLKTAVGGAVGGVVGVVLLLLLLMVIVKKKKRVRMVEMERRAYEEEASRFPWSVLRE